MKRLLSLLLAAAMLCGALPAALAADLEPPLYEQMDYESSDAMMDEMFDYGRVDYDWVVEHYRQRYAEIQADPAVALDYYGYSSLEELDAMVDYGYWESREGFYRQMAVWMVQEDQWSFVPPLSVTYNGEKIAFPDAQPVQTGGRTMVPLRAAAEAMGAQVGYQSGSVTVETQDAHLRFTLGEKELYWSGAEEEKPEGFVQTEDGEAYCRLMDVTPYEKDGRTYISARYLAEAFGLTVKWDEYNQIVDLYDRAGLVADIDGRFTILNRWYAAQPKHDPAETLRTVVNISMLYTELNSIDGNVSYPMKGKLSVTTEDGGFEADIQLDLYALVRKTFDQLGMLMGDTAEIAAAIERLKPDLENASCDLIYNVSEDVLYFRCPLLLRVMREVDAESLTESDPNIWVKVPNAFGGEAPDLEGQFRMQSLGAAGTVGATLVADAEHGYGMYGWRTNIWKEANRAADYNEKRLGDSLFTQSGDRYTMRFDVRANAEGSDEEQLLADAGVAYRKGELMLNVSSGAFEGSYEQREQGYSLFSSRDTLKSYTFSGNADKMKITAVEHLKNTSITEWTIGLEKRKGEASPATEPPKNSKIVDYDKLFGIEEEPVDDCTGP
ncbi:copper amine oxidase N-terminal domain-containing protein [Agathobaculum sp.]|uniref:copper amine oxidase N-terminal domain-containing protein n=1 Tax=Agathobaculum sp. TaxID=2048138 RepID=UPI002A82F33A|nr:copper amine oxidase N-terminal domain-containing protein [Agathobaculum sp.]MDY3618261.1 copper amine oxidase N-terminal domain-containing protein [Agathobaculum sp.]